MVHALLVRVVVAGLYPGADFFPSRGLLRIVDPCGGRALERGHPTDLPVTVRRLAKPKLGPPDRALTALRHGGL